MTARALEIKICGTTNLDDARAAMDAGADFIGFVLYARSKRAVTPAQVASMIERLPAGARPVGVFVNEPPAFVAQVVRDCGLWAAQIHGDEDAAAFAGAGFRVWRAVHFADGGIRPQPENWPAERYVLDARAPGQYGGTGRTIDWEQAAGVAARVPSLLAGGLTPENVAAAIRAVRPLGVDAVSGVEAAPGRKDPARLAAFIRAARSAGAP